jgi:hypothetical protein
MMGDTSWKSFERWVCRLFGGERDNDPEHAEECIKTGMWAPEAKYRKEIPAWLEGMMLQAESQARDDQLPLVVLTEHQRERTQALVVMRLQDVYDFFVGGPNEPPEDDDPAEPVTRIDVQ